MMTVLLTMLLGSVLALACVGHRAHPASRLLPFPRSGNPSARGISDLPRSSTLASATLTVLSDIVKGSMKPVAYASIPLAAAPALAGEDPLQYLSPTYTYTQACPNPNPSWGIFQGCDSLFNGNMFAIIYDNGNVQIFYDADSIDLTNPVKTIDTGGRYGVSEFPSAYLNP